MIKEVVEKVKKENERLAQEKLQQYLE